MLLNSHARPSFRGFAALTIALTAAVLLNHASAQTAFPSPLDPVRDATGATLEGHIHHPLPEQYIWTADAADAGNDGHIRYVFPKVTEKTEPHYFRDSFTLQSVPRVATLYIAGPRSAEVYLNGQLAEEVESDVTQPLGMHVFAADVAKYLHPGKNVIAMKVVRGRGVTGFTNSALLMQETFGEVLVAKIVPKPLDVNGPALMMTDTHWKGSTQPASGWEQSSFDDAAWKPVHSIGSIESTLELFQWNADAGLYNWPGYDGISPFLAHRNINVPAGGILSTFSSRSHFTHLDAISQPSAQSEFGVHLSATTLTDEEAPSIILDFGRELTGRLELESSSNTAARVTVQYGESYDEMLHSPYLGVDPLTIPPMGTGHGPKSSFRYVKIRFVGGGPDLRFKSIHVDDIFYPVKYQGYFESSDPQLNRIWEVGAYTAHLCMQDDIWDSPKRDRGRWMGDTDVMGRTINDVFGDRFLMEDTLDRLLGKAPINQHVNGIPGYSAFWFTGAAEYYRHTGSKEFLNAVHDRMVQLLHYVDAEFDARNLYANKTNVWLYVDWSPELNGDTPETRRATTLEFYHAYKDAAWMLRQVGDTTNADFYDHRTAEIKAAADKYLLDPATGSFGPRWQTNAAAVVSGLADPSQYADIWKNVLSHVGHVPYNAYVVTPYYNYYIISAMARMGHRRAALDWIRQYWGGMLDEGATSYWEAYDPAWFKGDFHASLQADNRSGYFVSLAHGWSSGPTPWLMEQMLGIHATGAGFQQVQIRPDLMGVAWAKGGEPTPHGLLKVDLRQQQKNLLIALDLPSGVQAHVSVPVSSASAAVLVNGKQQQGTPSEGGARSIITLTQAGHYSIEGR
ncbi:MAG: alpha-L-rhamnosidase-related protein [Acidobacteriaceae bacterium]